MSLPERALKIRDELVSLGLEDTVMHIPEGAHTAQAAADALGIEVGAIANSLVFWMNDAPILIMTSGRHRVDTAWLATELGEGKITRATPEQVRSATGQVIGGVAPLGHPAKIRTLVDEALRDYPRLSAAAGHPSAVFLLSFDELVRITSGEVRAVTPEG